MKKSPIRVLLVEDNKTDAQLIERQIEKAESHVDLRVVQDLDAVANNLREFKPHLIISDYRLPTCSGLEVLEKAENICPGTTFIFLTGAINDEELAANTILSGASGYFLKKNLGTFHMKLIPFFNAIKNNRPLTKKTRDLVASSKETIHKIEQFLGTFDSVNASHIDDIRKMREELSKLRKDYDF